MQNPQQFLGGHFSSRFHSILDKRLKNKIAVRSLNMLILPVNSSTESDFKVLFLHQFHQQVAETTTLDMIHCLCNHLTAFGGQLFVAPNPLNFDKVLIEFDHLSNTGNIAVIVAVSFVFGLYLLLLLWARKADMLDALKVDTVLLIRIVLFSFTSNECFSLPLNAKEESTL